MKRFLSVLLVLGGLLFGQLAYAQTTINSTTLSTAITDANATTILSLASIGSGSTAVIAGNVLFIDGEAMTVRTTPTVATQVTVNRHTQATRGQTHAASSIVYYGNPQAFVSGTSGVQFYQGSCTSSQFLYLPVIDTVNATIGNCLDSRWSWVKIAAGFGLSRPYHPVASAAYTAKITDEVIGYTALLNASFTVTLPAADGLIGKIYIVANESAISTNTIWVTAGDNIDGSAQSSIIVGAAGSAGTKRYRSNGTAWFTW